MQHYYIISFSKGYLPIRKKNPNRVLSWVNDAELNRLTALNAKINEGATLDSLRADIAEKEEAVRRIERTRDGCDSSDQELIMKLNAALIIAEHELRDAAELLTTAEQVLGGTYLQTISSTIAVIIFLILYHIIKKMSTKTVAVNVQNDKIGHVLLMSKAYLISRYFSVGPSIPYTRQ